MMRTILIRLACLAALLAPMGCASTFVKSPQLEDITPVRTERKDEVVKHFETRRNQAQYEAALESWERGDAKGCEQGLRQLLQRKPDHNEGRILLADLLAASNRQDEAQQQLNEVLQSSPENPQAHFSLGLLLESLGQFETAGQHFQQASQSEPGNELYRLSLESCRVQSAGGALPRDSISVVDGAEPQRDLQRFSPGAIRPKR